LGWGKDGGGGVGGLVRLWVSVILSFTVTERNGMAFVQGCNWRWHGKEKDNNLEELRKKEERKRGTLTEDNTRYIHTPFLTRRRRTQ
jgi:hypothetical protein